MGKNYFSEDKINNSIDATEQFKEKKQKTVTENVKQTAAKSDDLRYPNADRIYE